jgi:hypothetical protein
MDTSSWHPRLIRTAGLHAHGEIDHQSAGSARGGPGIAFRRSEIPLGVVDVGELVLQELDLRGQFIGLLTQGAQSPLGLDSLDLEAGGEFSRRVAGWVTATGVRTIL